ncbi:MAG TPA: cupin domain-containing protein [Planctomycetota bacterium]|nr:cupin domain-containing protein [Planctomycetota bacterium]
MIEQILGDLAPGQFLDQYYTRVPYTRAGAAAGLTSFRGWPSVEAILCQTDVDGFLAREGVMWEGGRLPPFPGVRALFSQGHTLVIRSAERHDAELARLADGFLRDFAAEVNVHVYCTPPGRSGFGWHYDPEDVFILQTHGTKEYQLRKNTVNPWPLLAQMPKDLHYEREVMPTWSCLLRPGDWLYLPTGWWHSARAVEGDSITLAIGLMTPSAIEVLDFLKRELLSSLVWRQRLPVLGTANPASPEDLAKAHRSILTDLGRDLSRLLSDEALARRYLELRDRGPGRGSLAPGVDSRQP